MDDILRNACEQIGWIEVYKLYLPSDYLLTQRPNRPEYEGKSPFPGSTDRRPSFAVNSLNGFWNDGHMRERLVGARNLGGNIVMFIAYMLAIPDISGRLLPDFEAAERDLRQRLGLSQPIDMEWYEACRARIALEGSEYHTQWMPYKPYLAKTLNRFGVGWCTKDNRLVIPIHDSRGTLINAKLYRPGPGSSPKMFWKREGIGPQNLPFPYEVAWGSKVPFFFVEGETDALSLLSIGIAAISGTMGANQLPWLGMLGNEFVAGRDVIVWTDRDKAGETYSAKAIAVFQPYAASIRQIHTPIWEGMPTKTDASDFVMHMFREGKTAEQIRATILEIANKADPIGAEARFDADPIDMSFDEAMNVTNFGRRFSTRARVLSVSNSRHMVPHSCEFGCTNRRSYCGQCAMNNRGGTWTRMLDHRSQAALDSSITDTDKQLRQIKKHFGIIEACPDFKCIVNTTADVQIVQVAPPHSLSDLRSIAAEETNSRRTEMFIINLDGETADPGNDYDIRGFLYPMGKNQRAIILADKIIKCIKTNQENVLTAGDCFRLRRQFSPPGMSPIKALKHVANDMADSVTGIKDRTDMHLMYRAVFYCAIEFDFAGEMITRGWLEAFVLGDTRCGKSARIKSMSNWLDTGLLVDCKMQSVPGLLGAVESSSITGERYVIPGLFPINDKRGPICMDEFTGPKHGRQTMMEALSSTRAEGVVTITKAASSDIQGTYTNDMACKPGEGRLLNDIPGFGVQRIKILAGQPEDVARFDMAMAVTQSDVDVEVLLAPIKLTEPKVPMEDARLLLEWARSRKPTDFVWEQGALDAINKLTRAMIIKYDQSIPLVESATQRIKLAKLAVANAICTFSSPNGKQVIITAGHVVAAWSMFTSWYDKPSFAYHAYSIQRRLDNTITDEDSVRCILEAEFGDNIMQCLLNLQRVESFNDRTFRVLCFVKMDNAVGIMRGLAQHRCIEPIDGRDNFRLTRPFAKWIENYIKASEQRPLEEQR